MGLSRRAKLIGGAVLAAALVGGSAAVVTAQSSGHHGAPVGLSATPSHPGAGAKGDSLAPAGGSSAAAANAPTAAAATPGSIAPPSTAAGRQPTATTPAAGPAAASHAASAASSSGTGQATPGTYRYRQTAPAANPPAEGTLLVEPSASGTQTWTRNFGTNAPVATSVMFYRDGGLYTLAQNEQLAGTTVSCNFGAPLPSPPSPPTIGRSFVGQATCTNQAILGVTGKITANAVVPLDGANVTTAVVGSNLVMAVTYQGTPYEADLTQVDWYAPSLRMPVQTAIHLVIPALSITTDSTYLLESSKPS
jgi:hypothetical protein